MARKIAGPLTKNEFNPARVAGDVLLGWPMASSPFSPLMLAAHIRIYTIAPARRRADARTPERCDEIYPANLSAAAACQYPQGTLTMGACLLHIQVSPGLSISPYILFSPCI